MKALILGAGQGRRLLPQTAEIPKALLRCGPKSLVEWQIEQLVECGIRDIVFVSGFKSETVAAALRSVSEHIGVTAKQLHNPFYAVSDNLASCWVSRPEMTEDFVLLNGDTLFRAPLLQQLISNAESPISIAVDHKAHYDDDDMKVQLRGRQLVDIGKTLDPDSVDGESIGVLYFKGIGPSLFVESVESTMAEEDGLGKWYLSAVARLCPTGAIGAVTIKGHEWCEVDFPLDLRRARRMVAGWQREDMEAIPLASTS